MIALGHDQIPSADITAKNAIATIAKRASVVVQQKQKFWLPPLHGSVGLEFVVKLLHIHDLRRGLVPV